MKALISFVLPTVKAIFAVFTIVIGMGWGAYAAVSLIARTEAGLVREEIKTLRAADIQHLDKRLDRIETLIKETR
jgi:hypothetical protein